MAKRKRLTPALIGRGDEGLTGAIEPDRDRSPIARVAAETATEAAFAEVTHALTEAREDGRLIAKLPLEAIETGHLIRDRIAFDGEDMATLKASLQARGQQVPVEVVALEQDGRYGLISGLRRVMALREIGAGDVLALVRQPDTSADAYLAMVEENEVRAGVSFYERARLVAEATRMRLFGSVPETVRALFIHASPAKRSKIIAFVKVHEELGQALRFPTSIPERTGLALSKAMAADAGFAPALAAALEAQPAGDPGEERKRLEAALASPATRKTAKAPKPKPREIAPGLTIEEARRRITLRGPALTKDLTEALIDWLETRK
ncbi:ParB/RepB/Spo0J family partition protein [Jannaschia sp. CCS1]|uniref:ParB/RepB/Spo0J family partition protein n=1 Tax=Jannaschia sp. (strain CCS1) TaxID=290400 RepID=UPI000053A3CB|nr:ParB N-terminal domain-containing protein [Jannaschia sp. CCS1]ABD57180.1 ParB-like nuclease [Jannaschia sp. CCS1]